MTRLLLALLLLASPVYALDDSRVPGVALNIGNYQHAYILQDRVAVYGKATVGRQVATFTCTTASKISQVALTAFYDCGNGTLARWDGDAYSQITITDSTGTHYLVGYLKAAGTGETTTVVFPPYDFTSGWVPSLATINSSTQFTTTGVNGQIALSGAPVAALVSGALARYSITGTNLGGSSIALVLNGTTVVNQGPPIAVTNAYRTLSGTPGVTMFTYNSGSVVTISTLAVAQVLSPSVTGTTIVSAAGGSTQSWTSMTVGFNLNDTTYTVAITRQK